MKKFVFLLLSLVFLTALCACGGSAPQTDFAPSDLTAELLDSSYFTDLLSEMDLDVALELYGIDASQVDSCSVYLGTGATAEEIAVFKAKDADSAKAIADALKDRVSSQIAAYENYVPAEVPKLKSAILRSSGVYSIYVTAADAKAAGEIIDKYMK